MLEINWRNTYNYLQRIYIYTDSCFLFWLKNKVAVRLEMKTFKSDKLVVRHFSKVIQIPRPLFSLKELLADPPVLAVVAGTQASVSAPQFTQLPPWLCCRSSFKGDNILLTGHSPGASNEPRAVKGDSTRWAQRLSSQPSKAVQTQRKCCTLSVANLWLPGRFMQRRWSLCLLLRTAAKWGERG